MPTDARQTQLIKTALTLVFVLVQAVILQALLLYHSERQLQELHERLTLSAAQTLAPAHAAQPASAPC